jgi:hypothetical protein
MCNTHTNALSPTPFCARCERRKGEVINGEAVVLRNGLCQDCEAEEANWLAYERAMEAPGEDW